MQNANFTDIRVLVEKLKNKGQQVRFSKEHEPRLQAEPTVITEPTSESNEAEDSAEDSSVKEGGEEEAAEIEVVPEVPRVDSDLAKNGVQTLSANSVFAGNKKIELPISASEVQSGQTQSLSTGIRWLAELTKYILAKFHIVIKKVGNTFVYEKE